VSQDLPPGWSERSSFLLERDGLQLHLVSRGMTNHELRNILIGLWLGLDQDDRADHVLELHAYATGRRPPGMSLQIAEAIRDTRSS
jgi:hypothetical protein